MDTKSTGEHTQLIDHLFRHQSGKMVSVLVRIFGLSNLELIEDAVQDTFIKAMSAWCMGMPDNPEGWLVKAAKNRAIDLLRSGKTRQDRLVKLTNGASVISIDELFLDGQVEDSQLRMIFTACHPDLNIKEQICFALKTISGFGDKEIAAALLTKTETIKKRLMRARKLIKAKNLSFSIPEQANLKQRLAIVYEVLYLIYNEGYHSSAKTVLIRKDLCAEAMRLGSLILKNESLRNGEGYALFAIFCFHSAKLDAKISDSNDLIDLKNQNRKTWNQDLINLGNAALNKAMNYEAISHYHLEAAILGEHLNAQAFEETNWGHILAYYNFLLKSYPSDLLLLNIALVFIQLNELEKAEKVLDKITVKNLEQRAYLYLGVKAELYFKNGAIDKAITYLEEMIGETSNAFEKVYLNRKMVSYQEVSG